MGNVSWILNLLPLYRWVIEHLPDGGGKGSLSGDSLGFSRRQQWLPPIHGVRTGQRDGVQTKADIV